MAKEKAVYAPGELSRVRDKLGVKDHVEAQRMAKLLGGEVGVEKSEEPDTSKMNKRNVAVVGRRPPGRRVATADFEEEERLNKIKARNSEFYPGDDPAVQVRLKYRERIKIDQYAGQVMFEIKSTLQVLTSVFSFFKEPIDYVNPRFVTKRLSDYYGRIEKLATMTRNLFPYSNSKRNNQLKRASPFVFKVVDTLRTWNIELISRYISNLQSHPRSVKVTDFTELLKEIYKPLFVLDDLNLEDIKTAFKLVYKILYIESPMEAKGKYQDVIRNIITALMDIRRTVHFGMYPLMMKLISDQFIPYDRFFIERRRRFMAFLNATASEQLNPADLSAQQIESMDMSAISKEEEAEKEAVKDENTEDASEAEEKQEDPDEDPNDPKVIERKAKQEAERMEKKSLEQGKMALEALYPKAGWDKLEEHQDLYPYFADLFNMRFGYELIAPTDPLQQVSVLMHILDDLFIGLRYVNFGNIIGSDGSVLKVVDELGDTINNWRSRIDDSFMKEYLPRLSDYCRMLENSEESRMSPYAKKNLNELHWIKRLYFFPYYKFDSLGPPPFQKQEVSPIYSEVRKLRKCFTAIAVGIEQGMRMGGAAAKARCDGINNPWEKYNFQVPNPTSKRIEALLAPERKNNATLIFFSISAVTVLDHILNNENSWAYKDRPGPLFRSIRDEGITPLFGVEKKLDADKIFKESLKKKQSAASEQQAEDPAS